MEKLIIFGLIALGSVLHAWWKKRQGQPDETDGESTPMPRSRTPAAPRSTPVPATKAASWEEEIKRLLEGNVGGSVPPPPLPPPIVVSEPARPVPPPLALPRPAAARVRVEVTPLPVPPIFSRPGQTEETEAHELHARTHMAGVSAAATLPVSAEAHSRASRLAAAVAAHMGRTDERTAAPRSAAAGITRHDRNESSDVAAVLALLKNPRTARQVFIANALIGPPKALEG
ncbi:MAG: hypothetical protein HY301_18400 [Verrucomicrobia bacterium]|nr:hypothetical protein [Verrucomicrobiota bacterium]